MLLFPLLAMGLALGCQPITCMCPVRVACELWAAQGYEGLPIRWHQHGCCQHDHFKGWGKEGTKILLLWSLQNAILCAFFHCQQAPLLPSSHSPHGLGSPSLILWNIKANNCRNFMPTFGKTALCYSTLNGCERGKIYRAKNVIVTEINNKSRCHRSTRSEGA